MNAKDVKEDGISSSFSDISQKISQLEARFTGPLNPMLKIQTDSNKHIQPVWRLRTVQDSPLLETPKIPCTPEKKKPYKTEELSNPQVEEYSNSLPLKRRKGSSPLFVPNITTRNISPKILEDTPGNWIKGDELNTPKIIDTNMSLENINYNDNYQREKFLAMQVEISRLEGLLQEKNSIILACESKISALNDEVSKKTEAFQVVTAENDSLHELVKKGKKALIKALRALEEKKRQELKARLFNDSFRLGRVTMVRSGTRFQEYWEDGQEITQTKSQLENVLKQKETLEKQKKKLKKSTDEELTSTLPLRLALLVREEIDLKEKLDKLEIEKNLHIQDCRRTAEEDSAKYSKSSSDHEAWPVLHGRYLLLSLLGKGGYSEVYRAYDLFEHIDLAIKFHQLSPNWAEVIKANYIKHALRENKIHRELNHPRIVKHYDTLEVDNNCFCTVLEYCPGEDLNMYMKKHKLISEREAKSIMQQIFAGLKYLNDQPEKVIHYDLKPHNILLNNGEVKITDFGLSKIMDPNKTNLELTSQGVGTYWYQAPECFENGTTPPKINSKVDVWSAGVIFYELLYGAKPFGNNMPQEKVLKEQVIVKATSVTFPPKPSVSNECKEFIRRCLEHNVDERWDVLDAYSVPYLMGKR